VFTEANGEVETRAVHCQGTVRAALPKDLPKAIRYLADEELDCLLRTAIQEAKRRGTPMPMTVAPPTNKPAASSVPIPKQTSTQNR
jgi:hypothetical protein